MSEISKKALSEVELLKEIYKKLAGESPALDLNKSLSKAQLLRGIAEVAKPIPDEYVPEGPTPLPILETYPETDETKAGQRFWYKGNEWHYMTQAEIDAIGWDVAVGFPSPINKMFDSNKFYIGLVWYLNNRDLYHHPTLNTSIIVDAIGLGNPHSVTSLIIPSGDISNISEFKNFNLLINLSNTGTSAALYLPFKSLSAATINDLFSQLPVTTKTVTIDVTNNPGSATCDTSIATAKGYTVVTS